MSRNTSLLILSSLLSASFPSIGWTQACFSDRPICSVRCPTSGKTDTVQITCQNHSTYYACNDDQHSLPSLPQCTCPPNSAVVKTVIYHKASLNGANLPLPAYEVTCVPSNTPVSPVVPPVQPSLKVFTNPSPPVSPATSPPASHTPSVSPPTNTPQPAPPSNGGSTTNVVSSPKPAPKPTPKPTPKPKHTPKPKPK